MPRPEEQIINLHLELIPETLVILVVLNFSIFEALFFCIITDLSKFLETMGILIMIMIIFLQNLEDRRYKPKPRLAYHQNSVLTKPIPHKFPDKTIAG